MPARALGGERRVHGTAEALGGGGVISEGGELSEQACTVTLAGGAIALGMVRAAVGRREAVADLLDRLTSQTFLDGRRQSGAHNADLRRGAHLRFPALRAAESYAMVHAYFRTI